MRLVNAEVLKLIRRRGLMAWSLILTVGVVVTAEIILIALHAANPDRHGPAGGASNLENLVFLVAGLGTVAAIITGSTAGTQDVANGVFRELVVTGRKRSTLFAARVPGAFLVFLPMLALGLAIAIAGSFFLAGDLPHPSGRDVFDYIAYTFAITAVNLVLAIGLAAFVSSRVVVGVMIAWNAIVSHLLLAFGTLGNARKAIDVAAAEHFAPAHSMDRPVTMSTLSALIVLAAWSAAFFGAGRWWTKRVDA